MNDNHSILIVEDELITAESIEDLLAEEELLVFGKARDAATALRLCKEAAIPPVVAICDINLKGATTGIQLASELRQLYHCEIIFLTAYSDSDTLASAFEIKPVMFLVKPYNDTQLLVAVQMALMKVMQRNSNLQLQKVDLTEREKEIAGLVAQGLSSKEVAKKLTISIETVKTHRRRMLQKNNISSFAHLVFLMNQQE